MAGLNFSSDPLQLFNLSHQILPALSPYNSIQLVLSTFQILSSIVIFSTIVFNAGLRKSETFLILANIVLNDGIFAIGNMVNSGTKLWAYLTNSSIVSTTRTCMYEDLVRICSYTNTNGLLMLLSLYRLIGVAVPIWYKKHNTKQLYRILLCVIYLRTIGIITVYLLGVNDVPIPLCGYLPFLPWASSIISAISIPWTVTTSIIYILTILITYIRLGIVKKNHGSMSEARHQLQIQIVWTLAMILLVQVSTSTIGNAMLVIALNQPQGPQYLQFTYLAVVRSACLISLDTTFYLPILVGRCTDFREALLALMKRVRGKGTPIKSLEMKQVSTINVKSVSGVTQRETIAPVSD